MIKKMLLASLLLTAVVAPVQVDAMGVVISQLIIRAEQENISAHTHQVMGYFAGSIFVTLFSLGFHHDDSYSRFTHALVEPVTWGIAAYLLSGGIFSIFEPQQAQ